VRRAGGEADLTVFREGLRIRPNLDNRNVFRRCWPNWVRTFPEGPGWSFEVKVDGYRIEAIKNGPDVRLQSRRDSDFTKRFASIARAVSKKRTAKCPLSNLPNRRSGHWGEGVTADQIRDDERPDEVIRER
jgi:hypothetical protein